MGLTHERTVLCACSTASRGYVTGLFCQMLRVSPWGYLSGMLSHTEQWHRPQLIHYREFCVAMPWGLDSVLGIALAACTCKVHSRSAPLAAMVTGCAIVLSFFNTFEYWQLDGYWQEDHRQLAWG